MARDKNIEDYPDTMPEDHAQVCRARLANELGVVHYVYDGRVREGVVLEIFTEVRVGIVHLLKLLLCLLVCESCLIHLVSA
jgi:hypothetical protein